MTDQHQPDPSPREALGRFRDDFGDALVGAVRTRERRAPRRRRLRALAVATVVAAAAVLVVTVPRPGDGDGGTPLLGATPAEAAVRDLQRTLRSGVLVRSATYDTYVRRHERSVQSDWTDLATREAHVRMSGPMGAIEFWNPNAHERWTLEPGFRARDGRPVLQHTNDRGSENASASASPLEEIDGLFEQARRGELTLRRTAGAGGRTEVVLEQRQRCYGTPDDGAYECPAAVETWPGEAPEGMEAITSFQTWWLTAGDEPRVLRYENGAIRAGTTVRRVATRIRYDRWEVLPPTAANLALVRPPAFETSRYLVMNGPGAVADGVRAGTVVCLMKSACPTGGK